MCDPVTIATISGVAATVMSGVAAQQQGRAQNAAAKYNARQMENEAIRTRNKGVEEENIHRQKVAQLQSQQRAQIAASGVDVGSGSALSLQEDTALLGDIDALRIRENYLTQAQASEDQAAQTLFQGQTAQASGNLALGTSLLTAATPIASKWYSPKSSINGGYAGASGSLSDGNRYSIGL